jgi:hypothetical protein
MKKGKTTTILPPPITTYFSPYLLDPLLGSLIYVEKTLIPLSLKKIRIQDTGKRKQFDELLKKYRETYEWKKAEEAEYNQKIKEAVQKRPSLHSTKKPMQFTRFQD